MLLGSRLAPRQDYYDVSDTEAGSDDFAVRLAANGADWAAQDRLSELTWTAALLSWNSDTGLCLFLNTMMRFPSLV